MEWSKDQSDALIKIEKWLKEKRNEDNQVFYLTGYAGTGKTTLGYEVESMVKGTVLSATITGKAALIMRKSGYHNASTIHRLIYTVDDDPNRVAGDPVFTLNKDSALKYADLLRLDECSMVNAEIGQDLLSFGVPILVFGDPGQLPPVVGTGFFTKRTPDARLTQVHRQALDNTIIRIATDIRQGKVLGKVHDEYVKIYPQGMLDEEELFAADQIITGMNSTREATNAKFRLKLCVEHDKIPSKDEKLICLRNNQFQGLFNGMLGNVDKVIESDEYRTIVNFTDDDEYFHKNIGIHTCCFTDPDALIDIPWHERVELNEFTYGYCITVHKAQGSQWNDLIVIDDGMLNWDRAQRRRWLYTAVTRAMKRLTVIRTKSRLS